MEAYCIDVIKKTFYLTIIDFIKKIAVPNGCQSKNDFFFLEGS